MKGRKGVGEVRGEVLAKGGPLCAAYSSPIGTSSSTSAIVIFPAVAIAGLWFLAVFLKTKFPSASPFHARTRAKSPWMASSRMYSLPPKTSDLRAGDSSVTWRFPSLL